MTNTVTQAYQNIQYAVTNGAKVTNTAGNAVKCSNEYPDAVKVYASFPMYYLSSAENEELLFDGMTFEEWDKQPRTLK